MFRILCHCLPAILLIATVTLTGCSPYFYAPTNQQVLNFNEKGDVAIGGFTDANEGLGGSVGYAITDHIALSSDVEVFQKSNDDQDRYGYDSYMWDNELIVFDSRDVGKAFFIPAVNFGYGFGEIGRNTDVYGVNVTRMFAQPSVGYKIKGFEFAFSLRFAGVKYDVRPGYAWNPAIYNNTLEEAFRMPHSGTNYFFTEPALTFGYGYKVFRLRAQASWASKSSRRNFNYIDNNLAISLNINLNAIRLFKKE